MTSNTESVILRRSPFLSPLRVEDIFDEVDKIPPDLPFLELSTLHCRLEERVRSTVTLAQLNSLFNCNAPSLVKVYREGLRDYADVTPVHGDGSRDAYISRNGQATRDQLSSRIKWRALLLLCCPIYEKNLWESAEVFNDLTLTTLNSNLGTNAPSRLQALFRAFPDIVLDRSDGEHLIFYPSKKPTNLSKDYIYHLFFKIVRKRKEIRLSELSREMKLHHSVELNVDTLRRLFRSNQNNPLDIILRNANFPRDKYLVRTVPSHDDVIIAVSSESYDFFKATPLCDSTGASTSAAVNSNDPSYIRKDLIHHIKEAGKISYWALNAYCMRQHGIAIIMWNIRSIFPNSPYDMPLEIMGLIKALLVGFEGQVTIEIPNSADDLILSYDNKFYHPHVWARMALSTCPLTSDLMENVHRKGIVSFRHLSYYLRATFGDLMAKELLKKMYKVNSISWICELLSEHIEVRRSEGRHILAIRDPYAGKDSLAAIRSPTDVPHTLSMTKLKEFLLATIKRKGYMMFEDLSDYCWNEYGFALNAKNLQPLFGCRQSYKDILESLLEGQLGIIGARKDSSNEDAYTDIYTLYWTGDMDPSEQKKSTKTKATQTNRNMADKLANFLQENGGISVMISEIPGIVARHCWEAFDVEVDYGSLFFASSLVDESNGRLALKFINKLAFIGLTYPPIINEDG